MAFTLRDPYQREAVTKTFEYFDSGGTSGVVSIGTAGGKTVVGSEIIDEALRRGWRVLWAVHTRELVEGAYQTIRAHNSLDEFSCGVEQAKWHVPETAKICVGSVQTLSQPKRFMELQQWFKPQLIILDEGHRAEAVTYRRIAKSCGVFDKECFCLLLTATPYRSDKVQIFAEDEVGEAVTVRDLVTRQMRPATYEDTIAQRLICNYDYRYLLHESWVVDFNYVPLKTEEDISDVPIGANGEYQQDKLALKISHPDRTRPIIRDHAASYSDMPTIWFCANVKHAHELAEIGQEFGEEIIALDGETEDFYRTKQWKRFQAGDLQGIATRMLFTEGADAWRCSCVVQVCPIANQLPYVQKCGRAFRPEPGTVEGTTSIEERLLNISMSSKPRAVIITAVDKDKRVNRLMQAPKLIGLPSNIDMQGLTMREALEQTYDYDETRREAAAATMPESVAKYRAVLQRGGRKERAATKVRPDWRFKDGVWHNAPLSVGGYTVDVHGTGSTREAVVSYKGADVKRVAFDGVETQEHVKKLFEKVATGAAGAIAKHKETLPKGTASRLSSKQLYILRCAGYSDLHEIDGWTYGKAMGIMTGQQKRYKAAKQLEEAAK